MLRIPFVGGPAHGSWHEEDDPPRNLEHRFPMDDRLGSYAVYRLATWAEGPNLVFEGIISDEDLSVDVDGVRYTCRASSRLTKGHAEWEFDDPKSGREVALGIPARFDDLSSAAAEETLRSNLAYAIRQHL
jgi:hypothetical protein